MFSRIIYGCLFLVCFSEVLVGKNRIASEKIKVAKKCQIIIHTNNIVQPQFGGVGFHLCDHTFPITKIDFEQVIAKRWRELSPSFARLGYCRNGGKAELDRLARYLTMLADTNTEVYLFTWDPEDTNEGVQRLAYAQAVVKDLEYLVRRKNCSNIKYYCMTNELSLNKWNELAANLPKFKDYHYHIFEQLKARRLNIQLLATDAYSIPGWKTIQWAIENMDNITGVYGGHYYINEYTPEDKRFYPWFLSKAKWAADMAKKKGKNFIIGEFGSKQDIQIMDGKKIDVCAYWDSPKEPMVGIQLAELVIAAMNAGIYALCNWTFSDFPDDFHPGLINRWGTFKSASNGYATRDHYYAYGLLARFFTGPSTVFAVNSSNELIRAAALQHHNGGTYSIAIVNRAEFDIPVNVIIKDKSLAAQFRKYVYNPEDVPQHPFGDLPAYVSRIAMKNGCFYDQIRAGSLTIYTTAYDDQPPAAVKNLKIKRTSEGKYYLCWQANSEPDFCYYRVYRSDKADFTVSVANQIGSTIATSFIDKKVQPRKKYYYKVLAVDRSGNVSE